jgi:hypothetical protein
LPGCIVDLCYHKTQPVKTFVSDALWVSLDAHVVALWTAKVRLAKTKHPTRGRQMDADKLVSAFELAKGQLLSMKVTRGTVRLSQVVLRLIRGVPSTYRPVSLRVLMDAGASKGSVFARLSHLPRLIFLAKAINYPTSVKQWEQIPPEDSTDYIHTRERGNTPPGSASLLT